MTPGQEQRELLDGSEGGQNQWVLAADQQHRGPQQFPLVAKGLFDFT